MNELAINSWILVWGWYEDILKLANREHRSINLSHAYYFENKQFNNPPLLES